MQFDLVFYPDKNEKEFEIIKGYDYDTTLVGIINFCNKFDNYNDMVEGLHLMGLIYKPTLNGIFKIHSRTSKESKPKVFAKGITFKDEGKFYNISYLQSYFSEHINDEELMRPIIDTHFNYILSKSQKAQEHLYIIRFALTTKAKYGDIYEAKTEINLDSAVKNFVRFFCERRDSKNRWVANYPNLMLLARIAIAHERNLLGYNPNEPIDDSFAIDTEINELKSVIGHYSSLITSGNITQEEMEAYQRRIDNAKDRLDELNNHVARR